MWKASDQDVVGSQSILLLQQETRNESLFSRQQQAKLSQDTDCTRTQAPEQNNELPHGLQQTLLSEAANGPATDVSNMQLDLDNVTLATALGLGGGNLLAQFHRTIGDQHGQAPSELSDLLAATLGDHQSMSDLHKSASATSQHRSELGDIAEADNQSDGDVDTVGTKRKGPMSEEDKKRRRQEINRQSARRIRERKSHEMEHLKQQNAALQQSQTLLLKYASTLAREKNVLVQRTLELTERWNQVAAENLELRGHVKSDPSAISSSSPAASTYHHKQVQAATQVMPLQTNGQGAEPKYAQ